MKIRATILIPLTILFLMALVTAVEGGNPVFIILSSDDAVQANGAFEAAREALENGHAVTLLLVRDGARLASLWNPVDFKNDAGKKPLQVISRLVRDGVRVQICPRSVKDCKLNEYELIYGVERLDPKGVIQKASMVQGLVVRY